MSLRSALRYATAILLALTALQTPKTFAKDDPGRPGAERIRSLDELSALWSRYKHTAIEVGRVVSRDEGGITTSEAQGYALLRAVWSDDRETFLQVWGWTQRNLQIRADKLFAWKWKGKVLDPNTATDADTDIALALILGSRRFAEPGLLRQAQAILRDIWLQEIVAVGGRYYVTAGNWAPHEIPIPLHVAYFSPYAYDVFAEVDPQHPWRKLRVSGYEMLHWIYFHERLKLPPEVVYLDPQNGTLILSKAQTREAPTSGYDSVPLFWRLALDARGAGSDETALRGRILAFFDDEWRRRGKIFDRYRLDGTPASNNEGLPQYASLYALAVTEDAELASSLWQKKLGPLWRVALLGQPQPYYLQNWLWFSRALVLGQVRLEEEFLGFLRPFDWQSFTASFPWTLSGLLALTFPFARRYRVAKWLCVAAGLLLGGNYLVWRYTDSLNFIEASGPAISIMLWLAEAYGFITVLFLLLQVGLRPHRVTPPNLTQALPSVDILVPIYSESLEILEKTLVAVKDIDYPNKRVFVLDDSHRDAVIGLANKLGATYIRGPRRHAKAGNVNHALAETQGELVVIFDTDHIPLKNFLLETVPYFSDPKIGIVQTPHHFYNEDIFQRAFLTGARIPNEQDMFNHAIQPGRAGWGGAFFVGSGAIFRRTALEQVGGFKLLSITEDIHTSQHLHALGWKSAYVPKVLAVGLAAENLASYLVQRRRWMLGCLQIFFKDNPLFQGGLSLRMRLGYFASLFYFFHPLPRTIFLITPLYFLMFHWHPIFSDVSVLAAHLIPYLVALPMLTTVIIPGWPRLLWGSVYETTAALPLLRSMFDLFLPKSLGFKVTPKGITSTRRRFDVSSAKITLVGFGITVLAIGKGLFEFNYFQIEKDAYFFNMSWAVVNLLLLSIAVLMAWERPQRRGEERLKRQYPFTLQSGDQRLSGTTHDISLSGAALYVEAPLPLRPMGWLEIALPTGIVAMKVDVAYQDRRRGPIRIGLCFRDLDDALRHQLLLGLYAHPDSWGKVHANKYRSNWAMMFAFYAKLPRLFSSSTPLRRHQPRRRAFGLVVVQSNQARMRVLVLNRAGASGVGGIGLAWRRNLTIGRAFPVPVRVNGSPALLLRTQRLLPFTLRIALIMGSGESSAESSPRSD